jgi:hypothetical protein
MRTTFLASIVASVLSFSSVVTSETIFEDSFESGSLTSANGVDFKWSNTKTSSVVSDVAQVYITEPVNMAIPAFSNWDTVDGKHSMRLFYPAGQSWTEQRFHIGQGYEEIWIRYWIRVPTNYEHTNIRPNNNKFFALWMDDYSGKGAGATVFWNTYRDQADGGSRLSFTYNEGNHGTSKSQSHLVKFIKVPEDRGRWMQVVYHVRASSTTDSSDGYVGFWRRWEGEQEFTRLQEVTDIKLIIPSGGPNGWGKGYLMGWANAAYAEDTEWLIDDLVVATHSLVSTSKSNSPNAPILYVE